MVGDKEKLEKRRYETNDGCTNKHFRYSSIDLSLVFCTFVFRYDRAGKTAISTSRYDQTYSFVSSLLGCIKNLKLKDFARISRNDARQKKRSECTARVETF